MKKIAYKRNLLSFFWLKNENNNEEFKNTERTKFKEFEQYQIQRSKKKQVNPYCRTQRNIARNLETIFFILSQRRFIAHRFQVLELRSGSGSIWFWYAISSWN